MITCIPVTFIVTFRTVLTVLIPASLLHVSGSDKILIEAWVHLVVPQLTFFMPMYLSCNLPDFMQHIRGSAIKRGPHNLQPKSWYRSRSSFLLVEVIMVRPKSWTSGSQLDPLPASRHQGSGKAYAICKCRTLINKIHPGRKLIYPLCMKIYWGTAYGSVEGVALQVSTNTTKLDWCDLTAIWRNRRSRRFTVIG